MKTQEWSKSKLKLLENDENSNKVEKPFVKHTMETILRKTEKDMKKMNEINEDF